jgi:hypothetical protein
LPQAVQVKRSSMSDSRTSSGHRSPLVNQDAAHAHVAHLGKGDLHLPVGLDLEARYASS